MRSLDHESPVGPIEPMILEAQSTKGMFSKTTKKRLQNSVFMGVLIITLMTTIISATGLLNGKSHEKECRSVQLQTVHAKICENSVLITFPFHHSVAPVRWNQKDVKYVKEIIDFLLALDIEETFKFYYIPDLIFVKNGTDIIETYLRDQSISIDDLIDIYNLMNK